MTREASCACGQLRVTCEGDPVRVSMCHCLACQKRSGSTYAVQARFAADKVRIEGQSREWARTGDDGGTARFQFCPECGSTVFYRADADPDLIAIAVGAFADPNFPPPIYSVYETRKHSWVSTPDNIDHYD